MTQHMFNISRSNDLSPQMPKTGCIRRTAVLLILLSASAAALAALPAAVDGQPLPSLAPVLERVTPSVVNVHSETRVRVRSPLLDDPFFRRFFNVPQRPRERVSQSLGSGVIVDAENGYILTNNHVIDGADDISVTLEDGRNFSATLIGRDPDTDVAVIQVEADHLAAVTLADSDRLQVGDFVVAVGNPFGLGQTVTSGIVSALGRTGLRGLQFQNFIQTDASINPGNSGGALINLRGELVGVNTAIFTPSGGNVGIGFAIPANMAQSVMQQLLQFGEVRRGTLGIEAQDLTRELAAALGVQENGGVVVAGLHPGAAGDRAGLAVGDVILSLNQRPIRNAQDFFTTEGLTAVGESVEIEYLRQEQRRMARVEVAALAVLDGGALDPRLAGVRFETVVEQGRRQGVMVSGLPADSRLAAEGFRQGDVITGINRQPVRDVDDLSQQIRGTRGRLVFDVRRGRRNGVIRVD